MTKKDYILKILELLKDDWEPARWLWIVIFEIDDEDLLNSMYNLFKKLIKDIANKSLKDKIYNSFKKIKNIRENEKKEFLQNEKELKILEKELDNLFYKK